MTKDLKTIDLNLLPLETLAEMANEAAEQFEDNAKKTVQKALDAGRYLIAAKEQCEHGEWLTWLGANWNYHQMTASRYMRLASKLNTMFNLTDAKNVKEALRMIGEPETAPRSERKPANVTITTPVDDADDVGTEADYPAEDFGSCDADPTPAMPTNRKTAKGSEKVPEDKKPRTATVVPEILDDDEPDPVDDWFATRSLEDVCKKWLGPIGDATATKSAAKHLRKLADKLDPPTKFVKPDLEDVSAYFTELKSADPDSFFDFYESKGWLVGKTSMKDWRASARKWVRENATNGSNGNGKAKHNGRGRGLTADEVFS